MARRATPHEKFVASLGCAVCGGDAECHHLLRVPGRHMMGKRAGEQFCIPLCPVDHAALHKLGDEQTFMATVQLNGEWLAGALWGIGRETTQDDSYGFSDPIADAMEIITMARYGNG